MFMSRQELLNIQEKYTYSVLKLIIYELRIACSYKVDATYILLLLDTQEGNLVDPREPRLGEGFVDAGT